jgi:hypothetical protein
MITVRFSPYSRKEENVFMAQPSTIRSIIAVVAGFLAGAILSLGTDLLIAKAGIAPPLGSVWPSRDLVLAAAYRVIYGILAAYITARIAPWRPLKHALILGWAGFIFSAIAVAATWVKIPYAHWYSIAVALISVPSAWLGGKLRESQQD